MKTSCVRCVPVSLAFRYSLNLADPEKEWYTQQRERFEILTLQQSRAVARFLRYLAEIPDYREESEEALVRYWGKYL